MKKGSMLVGNREALMNICQKALHGELDLDELIAKWPMEGDGTPFLESVYRDVEDAVEHFPAGLVTGEPDYDEWHGSGHYRAVLLCYSLLAHAEDEGDLLRCQTTLRTKARALAGAVIEAQMTALVQDCLRR